MRERVLHGAERHPGNVVHGIAEMSKLPIHDGGHPAVFVEEVAWSSVTLHQDDGPVVRGHVPLQPVGAQPEQRVHRAVGCGSSPTDAGDPLERMLFGRADRAERSEVQFVRIEPVLRSQIYDEILGHSNLLFWVANPIEPGRTGHSLAEYGLAFGVHPEDAGHSDGGRPQRSHHRRLGGQPMEGAPVGHGRRAIAQEQLAHRRARGAHVDEPRLARWHHRACDGSRSPERRRSARSSS